MMVGSHSRLLVSNVEPPVGALRVYSKHQKTIVQFLSQTSTTDSSNPMPILL
jgi:hypothetical protein